jgi:NAD(P)H dehydrogenase (quinone)
MKSKILIVYSHPDKESYNKEILTKTIEILKEKKIDYQVLDLYKMKFNPILEKEELNRIISNETKEIQNKIKESNKLIFIYPIWWGTMPAILKGFCDRVFTPGFAYKYINSIPRGLLKNKKALVLTTSGAPKIYNLLTCNKFTKGLIKNILSFCGIASSSYIFSSALNIEKDKLNIQKFTEKKVNKFLRK